ncbi:hypothetical protein Sjap_006228 [Stephania japonica]|uniref:MADS-box domain-containing protein n=1 Tax=Stephania japonica TaxID=461633 RepID=A0AAP0K828_9MAGN
MGRRKIEIKPISDQSKRQVTFSKRRQGLFSKARELCIRDDHITNLGIVVFSPAGKPFSFSTNNTSIEALFDRFLHQNPPSSPEKKKKKNDNDDDCDDGFWWDGVNVEEMSLEELTEFESELERLRNTATDRIQNLNTPHSSSSGCGCGDQALVPAANVASDASLACFDSDLPHLSEISGEKNNTTHTAPDVPPDPMSWTSDDDEINALLFHSHTDLVHLQSLF